MNRRNAFKALAGTFAAVGLTSKAKAGETVTIAVRTDTTEFKAALRRALDDQLGIPPEPTGVIGETYFKVGSKAGTLPNGKRLFLNGVDVTTRSRETDLVGGWNVMYDVDANGRKTQPCRCRVHRGVLEVRDKPGESETTRILESIQQQLKVIPVNPAMV